MAFFLIKIHALIIPGSLALIVNKKLNFNHKAQN